MKNVFGFWIFAVLFAWSLHGATYYVDANGKNPTPPYATAATAATNIYDVINLQADGDVYYVTNGTYAVTNTLSITKQIQLIGTGANTNVIFKAMPANTRRTMTVNNRYALVANVTLTGGYSWAAGTSKSYGGGLLIESNGGTVSNCVITGNTGAVNNGRGVGAYLNSQYALLTHSWIKNNSHTTRGTATGVELQKGTLSDCLVTGNNAGYNAPSRTDYYGGGVYIGSTPSLVRNCTVAGNTGGRGGGIWR